jgi:hypothetical protein
VKSNRFTRSVLVAVAALGLVGLAACSSGSTASTDASTRGIRATAQHRRHPRPGRGQRGHHHCRTITDAALRIQRERRVDGLRDRPHPGCWVADSPGATTMDFSAPWPPSATAVRCRRLSGGDHRRAQGTGDSPTATRGVLRLTKDAKVAPCLRSGGSACSGLDPGHQRRRLDPGADVHPTPTLRPRPSTRTASRASSSTTRRLWTTPRRTTSSASRSRFLPRTSPPAGQ